MKPVDTVFFSSWGQKYKHKCTHTLLGPWHKGCECVCEGDMIDGQHVPLKSVKLQPVSAPHTHTHTHTHSSSSLIFFQGIMLQCATVETDFLTSSKTLGLKIDTIFPHCERERRQQYDTCCKVTLHRTTLLKTTTGPLRPLWIMTSAADWQRYSMTPLVFVSSN